MTDTVPGKRTGHPYYMYDMIRETPESLDITKKVMEKDLDGALSDIIREGEFTGGELKRISGEGWNRPDQKKPGWEQHTWRGCRFISIWKPCEEC